MLPGSFSQPPTPSHALSLEVVGHSAKIAAQGLEGLQPAVGLHIVLQVPQGRGLEGKRDDIEGLLCGPSHAATHAMQSSPLITGSRPKFGILERGRPSKRSCCCWLLTSGPSCARAALACLVWHGECQAHDSGTRQQRGARDGWGVEGVQRNVACGRQQEVQGALSPGSPAAYSRGP